MTFEGFKKRGVLGSSLGLMHPVHLKELNVHLKALIKGKLWLQIIIGMILGVIVGIVLGPSTGIINNDTAIILGEWLALPGYFFLTVIQMIVVPLVFASVLRGIAASGSLDKLKKRGGWLVLYFLVATAVAVAVGIIIGMVVQPGNYIDKSLLGDDFNPNLEEVVEQSDFSLGTLPRQIVSVLPSNPLNALLNAQMLQIVLLSFIVGFALLALSPGTAKPILELMGSIQSVSMVIVKWVMFIAPLAVFGLLAQVTLNTGPEVLFGLGIYVLTVIGGLGVLMVLFMLVVLFVGRKNPFSFIGKSKEALLMAFSTNSSAAVMPLSIKTAEDKLGVRPETAQFIIPIGATVNMSGTALYHGLATMFMAQLFGITLPLSVLLALIVTVIGASIGTPATPGVGIVILSSVLTSAGIPLAGIPLILGVDRILEMGRTVLNVTGDLVACVVLDRFGRSDSIKKVPVIS